MSDSLYDKLANSEPIAQADPQYRPLFQDLQFNILTGHGKSHAHYFFVRFDRSDPTKAAYLLGMLARKPIERLMALSLRTPSVHSRLPEQIRAIVNPTTTSGSVGDPWGQLEGARVASELEARGQRRSSTVSNPGAAPQTPAPQAPIAILLTNSGYHSLNVPPPDDEAFVAGMSARAALLDDPSPTGSEPYADVDALIMVAYEPPSITSDPEAPSAPDVVGALRQLIDTYSHVTFEEEGAVLKTKQGLSIEPFGFQDGISQPLFYREDILFALTGKAAAKLQEDRPAEAPTSIKWDPFAPLALALVPDPNGRTPFACGSYFVFRKLKQDVAGFYRQAKQLAEDTKRPVDDVLADFVGRRPNGKPLAESRGLNDFDFSGHGASCPFHAHIRKVNPRSDLRPFYQARANRIVRRGIPYGPLLPRDDDGKPLSPEQSATTDVGILFFCAQASIAHQFEQLQARWANNPNGPKRSAGLDPIAGQMPAGQPLNRVAFARQGEEDTCTGYAARTDALEPVVQLQGGAYFFAPSISFLRSLFDLVWQ